MKTRSRNRLVAIMAAGCLTAVHASAQDKIVVDGSTTVGPIAKAFAEHYMTRNPGVNITVSESGSGNGAKSLINAACAVATMSRPMKSSEKKSALDAGVMVVEHIIALDGLAMIVHPSNPVNGLTIEQIKAIYSGAVANWKELGGPDRPIVVISRDTNSGTYETFEALVMKGDKMANRVEYVGSNGAIRQRVLSTEGAIGYVGLAFLEGVKALQVDGVEATAATVRAKQYPLARPLYMYTNGRPKEGSHLYQYVNLYATPEGRCIIDDTGFVSIE